MCAFLARAEPSSIASQFRVIGADAVPPRHGLDVHGCAALVAEILSCLSASRLSLNHCCCRVVITQVFNLLARRSSPGERLQFYGSLRFA